MIQSRRIAFALGDAGGISPELSARVLADPQVNRGDMVVIGDARVLALGARQAGVDLDLPTYSPQDLANGLPEGTFLVDMRNCDPQTIALGQSSAVTGRAALQNFAAALRLAHAGAADAVFFTPFNKHGMRLAKADYVDEIGFINQTIGRDPERARIQRAGRGLERARHFSYPAAGRGGRVEHGSDLRCASADGRDDEGGRV